MEHDSKTVFFNGDEIKQELLRLLEGAEVSIQAAIAWFTDPELFNGLRQALRRGVKVSLIVADNEDNERLPFNELASEGADVIKVKGQGRGIMHQKYVIIDEKLVASGSYNWSINAANNNSENLQIIREMKSVREYVANFRDLMRGPEGNHEESAEEVNTIQPNTSIDIEPEPVGERKSWTDDFDEALKEMVYAHFNRENDRNFREHGFKRSEFYKGDPSAIITELDSIHGHLAKSMNETHQEMLIGQLDVLKEKYESIIDNAKDLDERSLEKEFEIQEKLISNKIKSEADEIELIKIELTQKEGEQNGIERELSDNGKEKRNLEEKFAPHRINWMKLSFKMLLAVGLVAYLFLFYSSAYYILLHAENDAQTILDRGGTPTPPGIFDSGTWIKGFEKGGTTRLFLAMGVLIPLFLATSALYIKPKWLGNLVSLILGILGFDFFVAWKVSKTDHDIRFLSGITGEEWKWGDLWADSNFYLVFMFGAMGLFFFKFLASNVYASFHANNPEFQFSRMKAEMNGLKKEELSLQEKLQRLKMEIAKLTQKKESLTSMKSGAGNEISLNEAKMDQEKNKLAKKAVEEKARIQRITERYRTRIVGGNISHMWSMVQGYYAEFVNGWVHFVYSYYAPDLANKKQHEIQMSYETWKRGNYHE